MQKSTSMTETPANDARPASPMYWPMKTVSIIEYKVITRFEIKFAPIYCINTFQTGSFCIFSSCSSGLIFLQHFIICLFVLKRKLYANNRNTCIIKLHDVCFLCNMVLFLLSLEKVRTTYFLYYIQIILIIEHEYL